MFDMMGKKISCQPYLCFVWKKVGFIWGAKEEALCCEIFRLKPYCPHLT